jgi:type IV pilus assembly protein PilM
MANDLLSQLTSKISEILSFGGGGQTSVGLSIGSSSIKLVELKKTGKVWKLIHFGIVHLPEDVMVNREIVNPIGVTESIKTLVGQIKLGNKSICSSVSGPGVMVKRMQLDVPNPKDLQDQVYWEAEQYLPFDPSDVVMDYFTLSKAKDARTDLLVVAAKKSMLEGYLNCIEDAGLRPKIVDTDFFALQNIFEASYPSNPAESVAIIDIGASSVKVVVVHGGVPVFTKDSGGEELGGYYVTSQIQKNLNLSYADAETLKLGSGGGSTPQEVSDLFHSMGELFANEIKKSLAFYNASSSGAPVAYVLLSGGGSKMPGLSRMIEEIVGLPTQLINPFNTISLPSDFCRQCRSGIPTSKSESLWRARRIE